MELLYKIKVHRTRLCVILCDHHYPSVAEITDDVPHLITLLFSSLLLPYVSQKK